MEAVHSDSDSDEAAPLSPSKLKRTLGDYPAPKPKRPSVVRHLRPALEAPAVKLATHVMAEGGANTVDEGGKSFDGHVAGNASDGSSNPAVAGHGGVHAISHSHGNGHGHGAGHNPPFSQPVPHAHAHIKQARDAFAYYVPSEDRVHQRVLIESVYCPRILGHGARKLSYMRNASGGYRFDAWISKDLGAEYRIVHIVGMPSETAKFLGLMVRRINDEPDTESSVSSAPFDLKLLMPHPIMGRLIGARMSAFKEIETSSAAKLSANVDKLPGSEERIVNVQGVADSIHIAAYHLLRTLLEGSRALRGHKHAPFDPRPDILLDLKLNGSSRNDRLKSGERGTNDRRDADRDRARGRGPPESASARVGLATGISGASIGDHGDSNAEIAVPTPALPLLLPNGASLQIATAYETAKDSRKKSLRQLIRLPRSDCNGLEVLIDNIRRVTDSQINTVDDGDDESETLELDGPPDENTLAIYLIHRFVRKKRAAK